MSEDARKLLDNGWRVLLFRDGLGQYTAIAVPKGESVDDAAKGWRDHETPLQLSGEPLEDYAERLVFDGPSRLTGCGRTVAQALNAVTEKVLFRRVPPPKGTAPE